MRLAFFKCSVNTVSISIHHQYVCHYAPYMLFSTQQNSIKRAMQVDSKACIYHQYEIEKVVLNLHC